MFLCVFCNDSVSFATAEIEAFSNVVSAAELGSIRLALGVLVAAGWLETSPSTHD